MSDVGWALHVKRPFAWGALLILDRDTALIPEHQAHSDIGASAEGVSIAVHHAQDIALADYRDDDIPPLAEVEVRVSIDRRPQVLTDYTVTIRVPSGVLTIGDADDEAALEIGSGDWEVQVLCTPPKHADIVEVWLNQR